MLLPMMRSKTLATVIVSLFTLGGIVSCAHEHPTGMREFEEESAEEESERPAAIEEPEEESGEENEYTTEEQTERLPEHSEYAAGLSEEVTLEDVANVVEKYIQDGSENDVFKFYDEKTDTWLELNLVKIHQDRLAQTKDNKYFVCAEFRGMDDNRYDLDFFVYNGTRYELEVDDDNISIHKINDRERYTWGYNRMEDFWEKQPVPEGKEYPK
ncbi:MAG: hypothetical protein JETT_2593 [Candidatus Jettenia ecosi]|uniref:Lipoprotein n=1 Tax=Candidatus Jettenia ecosi TaxID=2494326 RepID=A0A533Q8W5_9BACT|nr:MAG: hypothetical protein JETT_2593 [Candidatus Jettenia ecosi]